MNPSASDQPASANVDPVFADPETATAAENAFAHPDPITGEPGAHPVGVGVGALGAGAAGAAIGALAGPVGMVVGAVIGAVAGGLAGKEVATTSEEPRSAEGSEFVPEDTAPIGSEPDYSTGFSSSVHEPHASTPSTTGLAVPSTDDAAAAWPDDDKAAYQIGSDTQPATPTLAHSSFSTDDPDPEQVIRTAAYYRYLDRVQSGNPGDEQGDWVEAEKTTAK